MTHICTCPFHCQRAYCEHAFGVGCLQKVGSFKHGLPDSWKMDIVRRTTKKAKERAVPLPPRSDEHTDDSDLDSDPEY